MGLFNFKDTKQDQIDELSKKIITVENKNTELTNELKNSTLFLDEHHYRNRFNPIVTEFWDGEKTPGELGSPINSIPDHERLRLRAYDLNLKTDIIKIITGKFFKWVVGSGLKLQCQPNKEVLRLSGINADLQQFQTSVEALFSVYSNSTYADYKRQDNLHIKAAEAFQAAFLGGDCLCIIRVEDYGPTIQVIDGQQIKNPLDSKGKGEGNIIKHGIEVNGRGEHVAYWVVVDNIIEGDSNSTETTHERVEATNSLGQKMAWIIYGDKARIDHYRGIPKISSILEKVSKMDRFADAAVDKAEKVAELVYSFEHDSTSTGENVIIDNLVDKNASNSGSSDSYEKSERTAHLLKQTTKGQVINNTPGAKIVPLSNDSELSFDVFYKSIFVYLCASVDIPYEVAVQRYEQNFSSSRAAINCWEFLVEIYRKNFADKFYRPFYRVWLEYNVLSDKIEAPGFVESINKDDIMALEAYYTSRFSGIKMPHIDPLKEAKAIRVMMGDEKTPIISNDQAAEMLGVGDWQENLKKVILERIILEENNMLIKEEDNNDPDNDTN